MQNDIQPIRFRFCKTGRLQFISHLDLLRTIEHAVLRAGLPVRFSEGFNPHAKLSFALPLSVGTESVAEYFDTQLTRPLAYDEAVALLNAVLPPELQMLSATAGVHRFSEMVYADYDITLTCRGTDAATAAAMQALYAAPLPVLKRTKAGEREVDISPLIRTAVCTFADGVITVRARLSAGGAGYLNPEYLLRAARDRLSLPIDDPEAAYYTILRREVYLADGETPFC